MSLRTSDRRLATSDDLRVLVAIGGHAWGVTSDPPCPEPDPGRMSNCPTRRRRWMPTAPTITAVMVAHRGATMKIKITTVGNSAGIILAEGAARQAACREGRRAVRDRAGRRHQAEPVRSDAGRADGGCGASDAPAPSVVAQARQVRSSATGRKRASDARPRAGSDPRAEPERIDRLMMRSARCARVLGIAARLRRVPAPFGVPPAAAARRKNAMPAIPPAAEIGP